MDADGLPLVGPGVDYTKVEAIHQKRTIAFINHFITHTASFLNRFSCVCEEKLETLTHRIQHLEVSMSLLEAKLSSVPGLENVTVASSGSTTAPSEGATATPTTSAPAAPGVPAAPTQVAPGDAGGAAAAAEEAKPQQTVSQDPRYARFFKMVQVGVPVQAVKTKMMVEGLDPDLIDTPDAPAPEGGGSAGGGGGGNNSESDFSDDDDDDNDEDNADSGSEADFSD